MTLVLRTIYLYIVTTLLQSIFLRSLSNSLA